MGGFWSKDEEQEKEPTKKRKKDGQHGIAVMKASPNVVNPYILRRTSSMYFDEEGHVAHEFYEEHRIQTESGFVRWTMKRLRNNLIPQGDIELAIPRLHVNLPVVLMEN